MLELVLKNPPNKPPFIGIKFQSLYDAGKTNADLINFKKENPEIESIFSLVIEIYDQRCRVHLIRENPDTIRTYYVERYSPDRLKRWLYDNKGKGPYNFSQLLGKGEDVEVTKTLPHRHNFVLSLSSIALTIGEDTSE